MDPNQAREMLDFRVQMEEALQPVHENLTVIRGQLSVLIDQDRRPSEVGGNTAHCFGLCLEQHRKARICHAVLGSGLKPCHDCRRGKT